MEATRRPIERSTSEASPTLLAKGALRRLAVERVEPTPENYARAYRQEAGGPSVAGALPPRAQHLVERITARAFQSDPTHAAASFVLAMNHGHWDEAERMLDAAPSPSADAFALLLERIVRGLERSGQHWTTARRKTAIQRVLDASRAEPRHLQQRLAQLLASWERDSTSALGAFDDGAVKGAPAAGGTNGAASAPAPLAEGQPSEPSTSAAASSASRVPAGWNAIVTALSDVLQQALPGQDGANHELAEQLRAVSGRLTSATPSAELVEQAERLCTRAGRVLQHRHHLLQQFGKLTLELTASLAELAESDSWVRGQCDAMRLKIEEGLTARGVRAVSDMLHQTRKRHAELRHEREHARDGLKVLIGRMLAELDELGSKTGSFHESVGRYATVIEEADSLESLTGVVREMVEESRTVQSLVHAAQQRLQDEHSKATRLTLRVSELEGEMKRLSDEVSTDQLTQVANRRGLMMAFDAERSRAERSGEPLAIALLDIDNFKRLNDELGHSAGDEALKSLAALVTRTLRPSDRVARYGGEEFVVLLGGTSIEDGTSVMTRLQRALTGGLFMHKNKPVFVTFSAGLTGYRLGERIEDALERADQALYEAKRTGKNKTCVG